MLGVTGVGVVSAISGVASSIIWVGAISGGRVGVGVNGGREGSGIAVGGGGMGVGFVGVGVARWHPASIPIAKIDDKTMSSRFMLFMSYS